MSSLLKIITMAMVVAFPAISCFAAAEPTPPPTATLDVGAMVRAAIATALDRTVPPAPTPTVEPTPRPTYTPMPTPTLRATYTPAPTQTPVPDRLEEVTCGPDCDTDYRPPWGYVEWIREPSVSASGMLTLSARIDERIVFITPGGNGGYNNISLTDATGMDRDNRLYGNIVPPGWNWTPRPGLWIAHEYRYSGRLLYISAQIDPAAAKHPGLELCLWSGGTREQNQLLDCVPVQQP